MIRGQEVHGNESDIHGSTLVLLQRVKREMLLAFNPDGESTIEELRNFQKIIE